MFAFCNFYVGTAQLFSNGLRPTLNVSVTQILSRRLKGILSYRTNYNIAENEEYDVYEINEQESEMSTELTYTGKSYTLSSSLQIGIPQTYIMCSIVKRFTEPVGKIRGNFRAGIFGVMLDYGVERRISAQSIIAATMTVGYPTGVLLKIRLVRGSQTYSFPMHLSDEVN